MWFRRQRRSPPPALLPSLDRLAELIERLVALLDGVALAPEPAPVKVLATPPAPVPVADGWIAFVPAQEGYDLLPREGAPPARSATIELELGRFQVLRLGPSPLPGDRRRCAFLEQEPPPADRTFRPVKEQSQIEDMRAAIRGDRERAEQARQRSTENVRSLVEPAVAAPEQEPEPASTLLGRLLGRS